MSVLRTLTRALRLCAAAAVVLMITVMLGAVVAPRLVGWQSFVVTSGSMEPTIPTGAVVAVRPAGAADIQVGDIITYHGNGTGEVITHRVVYWAGERAERTYLTKGDANSSADPSRVPVPAVIGQVVYVVPHVGYLVHHLTSPLGAGAAAALVALALLGGSVRNHQARPGGRRSAARDVEMRDVEMREEEVRDEPARV